jgi:diguanylate cyclase (GGDEF)-like protein
MQVHGNHLGSWRPIVWMCALALVGSIISTVLDLTSHDRSATILAGMLSVLLAGFLLLIRHAKQLASQLLFACTAAGAFFILLPIYRQHLTALFWAYPFICISYFILGSGRASLLMCVFCPAAVFSAWHWAASEQLPRIIGSLALTWLFAFIFSRNSERQHAEMQRLAVRDPLTGAANRREMVKEIERAVNLRARHKTPAALILFDVDHFKAINDDCGHEVGDTVLVEMVAAVSKRLRKTDRLFRMGGEEFVVLMPQSRLSEAYVLAEYLRNIVESYAFAAPSRLTISLGIAELEADEPAHEWLRRADAALYRAKELGRNQTARAASHLAEISAISVAEAECSALQT